MLWAPTLSHIAIAAAIIAIVYQPSQTATSSIQKLRTTEIKAHRSIKYAFLLGYAKLSFKLKSTFKRYKKCKCSVNSPSKWQRNPFFNTLCPGGFASTAFATSVLLASLLRNNSCCVQSLLCPPLRNTEPLNAAHMIKKTNRKHCARFSINFINSQSFHSQVNTKNGTSEVQLLYCSFLQINESTDYTNTRMHARTHTHIHTHSEQNVNQPILLTCLL